MNPEWFGDSFDIVKRFFIGLLKDSGYSVFIDPKFTGDWKRIEVPFLGFVGAARCEDKASQGERTALLLDPDTGIGRRKSTQHITIEDIIEELGRHNIVFAFDQSFSRNRTPMVQMQEKLKAIGRRGAIGFYYDSHARFMFVSKNRVDIDIVLNAIRASGLPERRLVFG